MSIFLVLGICFLLLLSGNGEGLGWNCFLHGGLVEDEGDNYGVSSFISMSIWRPFFPDGDIKVEMMSSPWNNFLQSLLRFVMVRSGHDKGLVRISFRSVFLILRWQKEEGRQQKEEVSQLRLQECWLSFVGHILSGRLLPSVCLYSHRYCKASYRIGFEIQSYSQHGYNLGENQFLDMCVVQSACNVLMYPAII